MFEWKKEYETKVDKIDEQHKKLFEIGNRLYELIKNDLVIDKYDKIMDIIVELKNYTVFHFQFEENYMMEIGYKKFLSHKVQHDDFIKKFNDIDFKKIDNSQDKYMLELMNFIYEWIDGHILGTDMQYVQK
ncbi:bacteriohemerythrin [Clostridium omnivorum]|uniref:Bacteriohemerythrin n=1 Tax=Clostridium omnivorum TaxID=1604902 RepID=A0ABQ5N6H1_9CLOT|nr:bacteriohemerythrin [Clostridium sp. E14]GLC30726.1 bacteriohemerythrin [Clostridium sp. E14]